jgi:hypothetical protein
MEGKLLLYPPTSDGLYVVMYMKQLTAAIKLSEVHLFVVYGSYCHKNAISYGAETV